MNAIYITLQNELTGHITQALGICVFWSVHMIGHGGNENGQAFKPSYTGALLTVLHLQCQRSDYNLQLQPPPD